MVNYKNNNYNANKSFKKHFYPKHESSNSVKKNDYSQSNKFSGENYDYFKFKRDFTC